MFCTHCGKTVQDGMKFCMYCGAPLSPQSAPEAPAQPQDAPGEAANRYHAQDYGEKVYAGKKKPAPSAEPAYDAPRQEPQPPFGSNPAPHQDPASENPPPRFDQDPFGTGNPAPGNFVPPQDGPSRPRREKRTGKSTTVILIACIAVVAVILAVIGLFLGLSIKDRGNIETVKSGYLGAYDTMNLQDSLYAAYGDEYDTATWEGCFAPFPSRGVTVTFSHSEKDVEERSFVFEMGPEGSFRLIRMDEETDPSSLAKDLNRMYVEKLQYQYQLDLLADLPYDAVLYGAGDEYEGDRLSVCEAFREDLSRKSVTEALDLDTPQSGAKPQGGNTGTGTVLPDDPTSSPDDAAPTIHIEPGMYRDANTDRRSLNLSIQTDAPEGYLYHFTVTDAISAVSRMEYIFEGYWDESASCIRYSGGLQRQIVNPESNATIRLLNENLTGTVRMENGQILWENAAEGTIVTFVPGETQLQGAAITFLVTNTAPAIDATNRRVVSATASSTIDQATVDNGPMVMFDGQDESSWQEGVDGYGIGETVNFRFQGVQEIQMMAFRMGNWRNDRYFTTNAAPKTLTLTIGDYETQVTFEHSRNVQYVVFSTPLYADNVTIRIEEVHAGTEYDDTCINEITVYGNSYE